LEKRHIGSRNYGQLINTSMFRFQITLLRSIIVQRDATIYSLSFPANCSTCFWCYLHSSTTAEGSNTVRPVPDAVITVYTCSWR